MTAENTDGTRSDPTPSAGPDESSDGLRDHPLLFGLVTGGYSVALVGSLIAAWVLPLVLGYQLDWTRRASGLFAADGVVVGSVFRVAFAAFPILFAVCVVAIDSMAIRSLTDGPVRNRRGLATWSLLAVAGLTALVSPVNPILPPYGLVRLLSAPELGVVGVVVVAVAGTVAGVAGRTIPVRIARDGVSLTTATRHAIAEVRSAPATAMGSIRPVVLGWGLGSCLLFVGTGLLGLTLGIFIIGILLLPIVLAVWGLAVLAFASGHLQYRLHTVSDFDYD